MRNSRRIERYEAKTNGDDPFSPFGASPMNRCFVAANATKQKLGNAMGDRFEFSLSRKETSTFFLPLSLRPFLSFSTSFPLPPPPSYISPSLFTSRMPRRFSFSRTNSPAYLLRLCRPPRRDNRARNVVIGRAYMP